MAVITDAIRTELTTRALEIRDELSKEMNTALRVGGLLEDMILYLGGSSSSEGDLHQGDVNLGDLLEGLRNLSNPTGQDLILIWNHGDYPRWSTISYSGGGTPGLGGTGDVTWADLGRADLDDGNRQINISHLNNALGTALALYAKLQDLYGCTWWGLSLTKPQGASNYSITNKPLVGVSYIEFTNGVKLVPEFITEGGTTTSNYTLRIEAGEHMAHIYATGGVSALGNNPSEGGGGEGGDTPSPSGVGLGGLLSHINLNSSSFTRAADVTSVLNGLPNSGEGATIRWDSEGGEWVVGQTFLTDIVNISHDSGNLDHQKYLQAIYNSLSGTYSYLWNTPSPAGSGNVDYLYKVGDVKANNGNTGYINTLDSGQILRYNNGWENTAFLINSVPSGASLTDLNLLYITLGNNKYSVPLANGTGSNATMGIVKAGTGLSASSGTLNHSNSITAANSSFGLYKLKYDAQGHITETTSITKADITNLGIPGQDTNTIYSAGNGLNPLDGSTVFSVKAASGGGLAVDSTGIKIEPNTNKRVLWGNQDKLVNSIGYQEDSTIYLAALRNVSDIVFGDGTTFPSIRYKTSLGDLNVFLLDKNEKKREVDGLLVSYNPKQYNNVLDIGWGSATTTGTCTRIWGSEITFAPKGNETVALDLTASGQTYLPLATTDSGVVGANGAATGLRIGDAVLYWDEANQALALAKYNASQPSSPTAANFYATGGVSALGMGPSVGSIDTMTFGNLTVTDSIDVANKIIFDSDYEDDVYIKSTSSQLHLSSLDYIYLDTPVYNISIGNGSTISGIRVGTGNKLVFTIDGDEYNVSYTQ